MKQLVLLCCLLVGVSGDLTVDGSLGRITGKILKVLDVDIESFLSIPYAKPPVGDLRFALPQAFGPVGDLQATEYPPSCFQPNQGPTATPDKAIEEDCLYLNVFRKKGTLKSDKKAVIAVIHGGGYVVGSSSDPYQNPVSLAGLGDVVLVSFNYRLGMFGFADMKELAPGNLGLYDQRLALQWIQDNIADFGGNPKQVTLMGVSAGSMSVAAQVITPVDKKNLFQSVVMDAGVVASNGFYEDSDSSFTRVQKVAKEVGCPVGSSEMVDCLRKVSAEELLPISMNTTGNTGIAFFVATTDGVFIPQNVEKYVEKHSAKLRKVRTIIGYAKDEGTFFVSSSFVTYDFPNPTTKEEIVAYFEKLSGKYNHPLDFSKDRTKKLVGKYYADEHPDNSFNAVAAFQADGIFKCPINNFVQSYSRHNDEVYVYQFERRLVSTYGQLLNPDRLGAFHYSPYLHFTGILFQGTEPVETKDKLFSLDAINMISSFAKSDEAPKFRGTEWPSYSETEEIMIFDESPSIRKGLSSERNCRELFSTTDHARLRKSKTEL